jgi:prepilin-type N-terminal cleavage/methylation domain-containing protein
VLQRIRAARENENGFTLTELLITIVILGVLAGIVVFAVGAFTNDGKTVACQTDRKNVEVAVDAFYAKTGAFPAGADDATRIGVLVTSGYLKEAPSTTHGYTITLTTGGVVGPATCP